MTAEIHQLAARRDEAPILRSQNATSSAEVIPFHSRFITACENWFSKFASDEVRVEISDEAVRARHEGRFEVWYTGALCELGPDNLEFIRGLLVAKLNFVNSMIQATKETP